MYTCMYLYIHMHDESFMLSSKYIHLFYSSQAVSWQIKNRYSVGKAHNHVTTGGTQILTWMIEEEVIIT